MPLKSVAPHLDQEVLRPHLPVAPHPMAVRLHEVGLLFDRDGVVEPRAAARQRPDDRPATTALRGALPL